MTKSYRPFDLHSRSRGTLALAAQGYFWTGKTWVERMDGAVLRGQMYVEYWIPTELKRQWPIVLIHGGGGQGLDFLGKVDGTEGWVHYFARQGFAVYVVDRPGHGRSPLHPLAQGEMTTLPSPTFIENFFSKPEDHPELYKNAKLHDKWPNGGRKGDPCFDNFMAGTGPAIADVVQHEQDCRKAGAELVEMIGPAILVTHSAGGPIGWTIADARPELVKAVIAIEPVGPPFAARPNGILSWGLTYSPLNYDPPANCPEDIARILRPAPFQGSVGCFVQAEPARQLPNLTGFPILIVSAEASWMWQDVHGVADFLAQAGARVEQMRLEEHGVHGNGHAMIIESNADEIAGLVVAWIENKLFS